MTNEQAIDFIKTNIVHEKYSLDMAIKQRDEYQLMIDGKMLVIEMMEKNLKELENNK